MRSVLPLTVLMACLAFQLGCQGTGTAQQNVAGLASDVQTAASAAQADAAAKGDAKGAEKAGVIAQIAGKIGTFVSDPVGGALALASEYKGGTYGLIALGLLAKWAPGLFGALGLVKKPEDPAVPAKT